MAEANSTRSTCCLKTVTDPAIIAAINAASQNIEDIDVDCWVVARTEI